MIGFLLRSHPAKLLGMGTTATSGGAVVTAHAQRRSQASFVRHVHRTPSCPICSSAAAIPSVTTPPSQSTPTPVNTLQRECHAMPSPQEEATSHPPQEEATHRPSPSSSTPEWMRTGEVTVSGQKAAAMRAALQGHMFSKQKEKKPPQPTPGASSTTTGRSIVSERHMAVLRHFHEASVADDLTQEHVDVLLEYYSSFLSKPPSTPPPTGTAKQSTNTTTTVTPPQDAAKQAKFKRVLLDASNALDSVALPHFLACGTALGQRREDGFISHDDDIDIGVFHRDMILKHTQEVGKNAEEDARHAMLSLAELMQSFCGSADRPGTFQLLDILGLDIGMELRLQHKELGVLVDVNLYYEDEDEKTKEAFWWTATHYEESAKRKHGMYRYRHAPFVLESTVFCGKTFLVPPVSYLEEYFGPDWQIPKQYSYKEGLAGEYRNIIDE